MVEPSYGASVAAQARGAAKAAAPSTGFTTPSAPSAPSAPSKAPATGSAQAAATKTGMAVYHHGEWHSWKDPTLTPPSGFVAYSEGRVEAGQTGFFTGTGTLQEKTLTQKQAEKTISQIEKAATTLDKAKPYTPAGLQQVDLPFEGVEAPTPYDQPQEFVYDTKTKTYIPIDYLTEKQRTDLLKELPNIQVDIKTGDPRYVHAPSFLQRKVEQVGYKLTYPSGKEVFYPTGEPTKGEVELVGPTTSQLVKELYEAKPEAFTSGPVAFITKKEKIEPPPAPSGLGRDIQRELARLKRVTQEELVTTGPFAFQAWEKKTDLLAAISEKGKEWSESYAPKLEKIEKQWGAEVAEVKRLAGIAAGKVEPVTTAIKGHVAAVTKYSFEKRLAAAKTPQARRFLKRTEEARLRKVEKERAGALSMIGGIPAGFILAAPRIPAAVSGLMMAAAEPAEAPFTIGRGLKEQVAKPAGVGEIIGSALFFYGAGKLALAVKTRLFPPKPYYALQIERSITISGKGQIPKTIAMSKGLVTIKKVKYYTAGKALGLTQEVGRLGTGKEYFTGFDAFVGIKKIAKTPTKAAYYGYRGGAYTAFQPVAAGMPEPFQVLAVYGPPIGPIKYTYGVGGKITGAFLPYEPTYQAVGAGVVTGKVGLSQATGVVTGPDIITTFKGPATFAVTAAKQAAVGKGITTISGAAGKHLIFYEPTTTAWPSVGDVFDISVEPTAMGGLSVAQVQAATKTGLIGPEGGLSLTTVLKELQKTAAVEEYLKYTIPVQSAQLSLITAPLGLVPSEKELLKPPKLTFDTAQIRDIGQIERQFVGTDLEKEQQEKVISLTRYGQKMAQDQETILGVGLGQVSIQTPQAKQLQAIMPALATVPAQKQKAKLAVLVKETVVPPQQIDQFFYMPPISIRKKRPVKISKKAPKFFGKPAEKLADLTPRADWLSKNIAEMRKTGIAMHPAGTKEEKRKYRKRVKELGAFLRYPVAGMLEPTKSKKGKKQKRFI